VKPNIIQLTKARMNALVANVGLGTP